MYYQNRPIDDTEREVRRPDAKRERRYRNRESTIKAARRAKYAAQGRTEA